MSHVLFVCGKNKCRSPTAEQVFSECPGVHCSSAGLSRDAVTPLSVELVEWADLIFVMEQNHRKRLSARFRKHLAGKRVVCLDIPDSYRFMEPALIERLKARATPHLPEQHACS